MKFNVRGSKIKVTSAIKNYIEEKIGRLDKYLESPEDVTATVLIKVKGHDQTIEITIPVKNFILRSEESNKDLYSAIDLASDKLERQIRKNKTRLKKRVKTGDIGFDISFKVDKNEEDKNSIVRHKCVDNKPMSEEEAILQMNLLGHEFFVFNNADTSNICVLYRRKDGNYGIIETK